ncbi:uncharacterized protein LOC142989786 [Genypterus blacodes]|uniref:uncharacterized protein LOC142989786 n=1 Tax=Genypterus blacodes TaxID=154954 RepID=UPI003F76D6E4
MQQNPEKFEAPGPSFNAATFAQRGLIKKSSTHLAKIAMILEEAPDKMLTFSQLMEKLEPYFSEDKKSVENNIRVCLSASKCFVKVPVIPSTPGCKRNYWKLDPSRVTAKMVRRHFKGILELFPELASKVEAEKENRGEPRRCPEAPANQVKVKFSGPFSIESLLGAGVGPATPPPSPPSPPVLRSPPPISRCLKDPWPMECGGAASSSAAAAYGGFFWDSAPERQDISAAQIRAQISFPTGGAEAMFRCSAPCYTGSHGGYITYPAPALTHDYRYVWL